LIFLYCSTVISINSYYIRISVNTP
jgi:hypothetical protein